GQELGLHGLGQRAAGGAGARGGVDHEAGRACGGEALGGGLRIGARPGPAGRALAEAMQAEFLALPGADARRVAAAASTLAGARK
ncbi:MAG: hypothetical protein AAFV49_09780, partial [Pseudomonadota bacterium]